MLVVTIFVAFATWAAIGTSSEEWARRALIFGAIEAPVAIALGWYFGSAIQSERVAQAEARVLPQPSPLTHGDTVQPK